MKPGHALLLVVTAALAVGFWVLSPGQAQPAGGGLNVVAVVNIGRIFRESKEMLSLKDQFKVETDQLKTEEKTRRGVLEKKEAELKDPTLRPDSKEFDQRQNELLHLTIDYRVWMEESRVHLINKHRIKNEFFYQKLVAKVAEAAREQGFQVVIYKEDFEVKNAKDPEDLEAMIREHKVLYNAPRCDLTDDVLKRLNAE